MTAKIAKAEMSDLAKHELAYVLYLRSGMHVKGGASRLELECRVGRLSEDEWAEIRRVRSEAEQWKSLGLDAAHVRRVAKLKFSQSPPVVDEYFAGKNKAAVLLAMMRLRPEDVELRDPELTDEQRALVQTNHPRVIVNAGPGTGKTTVAVMRVRELWRRGENVALITFMNDPVDECYRRLLLLGVDKEALTVHGGKLASQVFVGTVDSLVGCCVQSYSYRDFGAPQGNEFDSCIREFIESGPAVKFGVRHVVVDEAQDIDELRWAAVCKLVGEGRVKTLMVLGDPRQRVYSARGKWYDELWRRCDSMYWRCGLTRTFRVRNGRLLRIMNALSRQRPELHVELSSPLALQDNFQDVSVCEVGAGAKESILVRYAENLNRAIKAGALHPCDIAVVTPALKNDSKTSRLAHRLKEVLREKVSSEIKILTIEKAKGREFELVILVEIGALYDWLAGVMDRSTAMSKEFVAWTRARSKVTAFVSALKDRQFITKIPRELIAQCLRKGIELASAPQLLYCEGCRLCVSSLTRDHGFHALLDENDFFCDVSVEERSEIRFAKPFELGDEDDALLWGTVIGLVVETYIARQVPDALRRFAEAKYVLLKKDQKQSEWWRPYDPDNNVLYGCEGGVNTYTREEFERLKRVLKSEYAAWGWKEWFELGDVLNFMTTCARRRLRRAMREEIRRLDFPRASVARLADWLRQRFGAQVTCEKYLRVQQIVGYADLVFERAVVELKWVESVEQYARQAYVYASLEKKEAYVYNMRTGELARVRSAKSYEEWSFIMNMFGQLRVEEMFFNRLTHDESLGVLYLRSVDGYAAARTERGVSQVSLDNMYKSVFGRELNCKRYWYDDAQRARIRAWVEQRGGVFCNDLRELYKYLTKRSYVPDDPGIALATVIRIVENDIKLF